MFWCFGKKSRNYHCKIVLLDETEFIQDIQETSRGQQLLDVVFKHLNLMETAYFGLRFMDATGQRHWLDPNKNIVKQMKVIHLGKEFVITALIGEIYTITYKRGEYYLGFRIMRFSISKSVEGLVQNGDLCHEVKGTIPRSGKCLGQRRELKEEPVSVFNVSYHLCYQ
ncbi:FERM domain-containing protein [Trichonephila clavata]|uniref:FERM domain-containing protein n=1 Tax=Trichonephila clavata TaxID=2740835 RepID=A0A8X6G5Y6_TRICU|nr:FERM domain-containing protein [Trichonephila clavata]